MKQKGFEAVSKDS